jgi:NADPH2:quinone reductase
MHSFFYFRAATCRTANVAYIRSLGPDRVIDYQTEDVCQAVRDWSAEGVDVVLDAVGPATLPYAFEMLRSGGRLINILTATVDGDIERDRKEPSGEASARSHSYRL